MVGVLDQPGLLALLRKVEGRRLLGVIDCYGAIELVFSGDGPNLVTFYIDNGPSYDGMVALGGVHEPAAYARDCREWDQAA